MITGFDRYVALDLETTGLEQDAEIIEIGLVFVNGDKIVDQWQRFVKPTKPLPREITRLTGITPRMLEDAPAWEDICDEVAEKLEGRLLLAHNAPFDRSRLNYAFGRDLPNDWLDSHDIAKLFMPSLTSYKLVAIAADLGVEDPGHHRALNDAYVAAAVTQRLYAEILRTDPFVLQDMANVLAVNTPLRRLLEAAVPLCCPAEPKPEALPDWHTAGTPQLDFAHAADFFAADGLMAVAHQAYEERPEQSAMLSAISKALETRRHAIIEAGTGTGKSFAYLVPALLWSYENDSHLIVSTATITLQEQLYRQDIPFLRKALGFPFEATISKGRSNYLCRRRFLQSLKNVDNLADTERIFLAALIRHLETDPTGDKERLNFNKLEHQYWQGVAATADTCLNRRCPHFNDCYYFNNRRAAEKSQVIIVNHSLLLQDLKHDGGILPQYDQVIIDEAHHLEDEATRQWTDTIDLELLRKSMAALKRPQGILNRLKVKAQSAPELVFDTVEIDSRVTELRQDAEDLENRLKALIAHSAGLPELQRVSDKRLTDKVRHQAWWQDLAGELSTLLNLLTAFTRTGNRLLDRVREAEDLEGIARELLFSLDTFKEALAQLETLLSGENTDYVHWLKSIDAGWGKNLLLYSARIDIAPLLKEGLFNAKDSVILTSATLAVNRQLTFTAEKYLLDPGSYVSFICAAPFDYAHQSLIAIPTDHPDYSKVSDMDYSYNVARDLAALIPAVDGDMLVLFTSYAMLNRVYFALKKDRSLKDYTILGHGQDGNRSSIIATMQRKRKTVVLGASSFWEGVDVPGAHLRTVVIAKLPFAPPTMPVESARSERLEAQGKSAFAKLSLPHAILRFRQGAGRLIRSGRDHGAIVILDNRLLNKNYGRQFIGSLPEQPLITADMAEICSQLNTWLKEKAD